VNPPEDVGVESGVQLVQRPEARGPRLLSRGDCNGIIHHRCVDNLFCMNEYEPLVNFDSQLVTAVLPFRHYLDDALQLLVDDTAGARDSSRVSARPASGHGALTLVLAIVCESLSGPLNGHFEPWRVYGLQQIVNRIDLKRLDCVLVEGGHEDDFGGVTGVDQPAGDLEPRQSRHLDIQEDDVGPQALNCRQRVHAITRLAHDFHPFELFDQEAQLVAGEPFIVDQDHTQVQHLSTLAGHSRLHQAVTRSATVSSGISTLTDVPWSRTLVNLS